MSAELLYSEILDAFKTLSTDEERIAYLRKQDHQRFRDFLQYAFNPKIEFDVKIPEYRPAQEPAGLNFTYLDIELGKMYLYIKGHSKRSPDLTPERQTSLFKSILEALHKDEAAYLVKMVNKDLEIPTLTKKLINQAYPNLEL